MEFRHTTVLLHEMIDSVLTNPHGIYVDCTLGAGAIPWLYRKSWKRMLLSSGWIRTRRPLMRLLKG